MSPSNSVRDGDLGVVTTTDNDVPETPLESTKHLLATKRSLLNSSRVLRLVSVTLHLTLVVIHLALFGVLHKSLEHRLIFSSSLRTQKMVSFSITAILTTFVTVLSAGLVLVTQVLSTRRNLTVNQTLTATHDAAAAWSGIGSAMVHIWRQRTVLASVFGVMSPFLYLGNILVLHITIPALFSLQSFNSTQSFPVTTQSFPAFNFSGYNFSSDQDRATRDVITYAAKSLSAFDSIVQGAPPLGLSGGTLYDVLELNAGTGNVTVNATGFNVTCSYFTDFKLEFMGCGMVGNNCWAVISKNGSYLDTLKPMGKIYDYIPGSCLTTHSVPGIIKTSEHALALVPNMKDYQFGVIEKGIFLYSTAKFVDSEGNTAFGADLTPSLVGGDNQTASAQMLLCSPSLVVQQAVVDAQSRQLIEVTPGIKKTASFWPSPIIFPSVSDSPGLERVLTMPETSLMDLAYEFYRLGPEAPPEFGFQDSSYSPLSVTDLFLMQQLNLVPISSFNRTDDTRASLHELENGLSTILASMMWTMGNMPFPKWYDGLNGGDLNLQSTVSTVVHTLQGKAEITREFTQTRLDRRVISQKYLSRPHPAARQVIGGLVVSIVLTLLSLPITLSFHRDTNNAQDVPIDGTGILHAIWLYRNHPELEGLVGQVEHPTDHNLRTAGMVRINLVRGGMHSRRSRKEFEY
ncbi:hypothetical protein B0H13DRAFT_1906509 [Mycena leptocephala]|nr:hypothetical protein B0H13DRAFT_1906509 [Mycena leptocephala]